MLDCFWRWFSFKAFQYIGARLSMLVMTLSPPLAAFFAYIYLGESLSNWGIIGIVITIFGVSLVVLKRSEQPSNDYKKQPRLLLLFRRIRSGCKFNFGKRGISTW
ncbi:MAG: DMT family transporter [Ignavibacteriales bacterium]|nr:DMT family transporter [Ignavibacteriales bacterium]